MCASETSLGEDLFAQKETCHLIVMNSLPLGNPSWDACWWRLSKRKLCFHDDDDDDKEADRRGTTTSKICAPTLQCGSFTSSSSSRKYLRAIVDAPPLEENTHTDTHLGSLLVGLCSCPSSL